MLSSSSRRAVRMACEAEELTKHADRRLDAMRDGFPAAILRDHATRRPVAFSAGLTEALPHDDRGSILYRADRALYATQAEGGNRPRIGFGKAMPSHP